MSNSLTSYVGIDISKETFNYHYNGIDGKTNNCLLGFQKLLKQVPTGSVFAMEATGVYHLRLATYLYNKGFKVMVINPLRVKRFCEALGHKAKHDKKDAKSIKTYSSFIAWYASTEEAQVYYWQPMTPKQAKARAIVSIISGLNRFANASHNINHALGYTISKSERQLLSVMPNIKKQCQQERKVLEKELFSLVSELYPKEFKLLKSIKGIGAYTASLMLVCARGLKFPTYRQFASFVGIVPSVKESGTSVKGKGKTVKTGNPNLRASLQMCAMSALQYNEVCKSLYNRLLAAGKAKSLAQIAVAHRLVKIAFGVVRSGEPYRGNRITLLREY